MSVANEKNKKANVPAFVVKLLIIATMVLYIILGWKEAVTNINMYLNSAIMSVYIFLIASFVQQTITMVINGIKFKSARGKTVSTLLCSLVKYFIAIVAIIAILVEFLGYKYMTELFAGLGVAALIVGLGCQSLISDVVAGIFMVFEGNFQVGDVVVVGGWRGTVNEIGLRTTVIQDAGGNLKIINNSSISEVVNNSQVLSSATCTVGIEYDESLERVEEVINNNLESFKDIAGIVEGPFYLGVNELAGSSVNLLFMARCEENDKYPIQRELNRRFKLLFDANDINIPYAQVTISNRDKCEKAAAKEEK